jgi:hypothetical protein
MRVAPFDPDASLLYLKITTPPCGVRMPAGFAFSGMLPAAQIEQIREWIACGAPYGDAGCLEAAAPDASDGGDGGDF